MTRSPLQAEYAVPAGHFDEARASDGSLRPPWSEFAASTELTTEYLAQAQSWARRHAFTNPVQTRQRELAAHQSVLGYTCSSTVGAMKACLKEALGGSSAMNSILWFEQGRQSPTPSRPFGISVPSLN